jgi:hypothetical protein
MGCINVIVNIQDYDSNQIYKLYIRPVGSMVDFGLYPQYTKYAAGSQVVFDGLPDNVAYEVGIQKNCGKELSQIVWKTASSSSCPAPDVVFDTDEFQLTFPAGSNISLYQWAVDGYENNLEQVTDDPEILTLADIGLTPYFSARLNSIIEINFRSVCGSQYSAYTKYLFIDTPSGTPKITKLKDLCENNIFKGILLRFTIGLNTTNDEELIYAASSGDVSLGEYTRTNDRDADIAHYKTLLNGFNPLKTVDGEVSFDFISLINPLGASHTGDVPCGVYDNLYEVNII